MHTLRRQRAIHTCLALAATVAATAAAAADDTIFLAVQNDTGVTAQDLHIELAGGAGAYVVSPAGVFAFGCPAPSVSIAGDTLDIDWGTPCVMPGAYVSVTIHTPNGPLSVVDVCWTDANHVIIDCPPSTEWIIDPDPFPPGGINKIHWIGFQVRCMPKGGVNRKECIPWIVFPGQPCWWRWCCIRGLNCEFRRYVGCAILRGKIIIGIRRAPVGPWLPDGMTKPRCFWERRTLRPQGLIIPFPIIPGGPEKFENPPEDPNEVRKWRRELEDAVAASVDPGDFDNQATLSATFRSMFNALPVTFDLDPNTTFDPNGTPGDPNFPLPEIGTTSVSLQAMAPNYAEAAIRLQPLIDGINDAFANEASDPNFPPELPAISGDLLAMQARLFEVSESFSLGSAGDPNSYRGLRDAFAGFALNLNGLALSQGNPRYDNAAENADFIAQNFDLAAQMVATGFPTPTEVDNYFWTLVQGFGPMLEHLSTALDPHIRVEIGLGIIDPNAYVWGPGSVDGVRVEIQDADSLQPLDLWYVRLSEIGQFDIPIDDSMGSVNVLYKLPTHLAVLLPNLPAQDGLSVGDFSLINGDVDGDNCITDVDVQAVMDDLGAGGADAGRVPPTDLNADGVVNETDLGIVAMNVGICGDELPALPCVGDLDGDADADLDDLTILLQNFQGPDASSPGGDIDGDGDTDLDDLTLLLQNFGTVCA